MNFASVFLLGIILSAITVGADALIKSASLQKQFSEWKYLLLGAIIYAITALGWFFLMRRAKLFSLGALYSVTLVVLITLVSVFYFKEKINSLEIFGIFLAIISILILYRFA